MKVAGGDPYGRVWMQGPAPLDALANDAEDGQY